MGQTKGIARFGKLWCLPGRYRIPQGAGCRGSLLLRWRGLLGGKTEAVACDADRFLQGSSFSHGGVGSKDYNADTSGDQPAGSRGERVFPHGGGSAYIAAGG